MVNEDFLESLLEKKSGSERLRTLKLEMSQLRKYLPKGTSEEVVVQTIHSALAAYFSKEDGHDPTDLLLREAGVAGSIALRMP